MRLLFIFILLLIISCEKDSYSKPDCWQCKIITETTGMLTNEGREITIETQTIIKCNISYYEIQKFEIDNTLTEIMPISQYSRMNKVIKKTCKCSL